MTRTELINSLINKYNYQSYLEIGAPYTETRTERNFDNINIQYKFCVDPNPEIEFLQKCRDGQRPVDFIGTSDDYFNSIDENIKFDIIFIDGLHHSKQVTKDIANSLKHLSKKGIIVCHDCLPTEEIQQLVPRTNQRLWTGDVWKALATLRMEAINLEIRVVDTDWGCGLIKRGSNIPYIPKNQENALEHSYFECHKQELLDVITVKEFKELYL